MSKLLAEWLGVTFLALVVVSALGVTLLGFKRAMKDKSPPGFWPQFLVSSLVIVVIMLGGYEVGAFKPIVTEASVALAALIPLSISPWLAYLRTKHKKGDGEAETETKPTGAP